MIDPWTAQGAGLPDASASELLTLSYEGPAQLRAPSVSWQVWRDLTGTAACRGGDHPSARWRSEPFDAKAAPRTVKNYVELASRRASTDGLSLPPGVCRASWCRAVVRWVTARATPDDTGPVRAQQVAPTCAAPCPWPARPRPGLGQLSVLRGATRIRFVPGWQLHGLRGAGRGVRDVLDRDRGRGGRRMAPNSQDSAPTRPKVRVPIDQGSGSSTRSPRSKCDE